MQFEPDQFVPWIDNEYQLFARRLDVKNGIRCYLRDSNRFSVFCAKDASQVYCQCGLNAQLIPTIVTYRTGATGAVLVYTGRCDRCQIGISVWPDFFPFPTPSPELEPEHRHEIVFRTRTGKHASAGGA